MSNNKSVIPSTLEEILRKDFEDRDFHCLGEKERKVIVDRVIQLGVIPHPITRFINDHEHIKTWGDLVAQVRKVMPIL